MGASKNRKGEPTLPVKSLTEAMGLGGRIKVGEPNPIKTVREVAGHGAGKAGAGTKGAAKPFTTIHKGAGWDGPKPSVRIPHAPSKKGGK